MLGNYNLYTEKQTEAIVAQEHKRATVNATIVVSIPTRGNEIFNIFIFLVTAHSAAFSSATTNGVPKMHFYKIKKKHGHSKYVMWPC